ncbi:MAG: glutamate 5-kinase [Pontixanthobacter sp.]
MPIETLAELRQPQSCPTLVVKIGSSLLVGGDGTIRDAWLDTLVEDIVNLRRSGQRIVLVSSGAIALGALRMGIPRQHIVSLADAQAAASVGQIALAGLWSRLLSDWNAIAAQILLTLSDLEDRRRYLNASATLARLLDAGVVPVINENDSVATEEIRFGDNDRLAARVAQAAGAQAVILLSDVDGLMDRDPRDPDARLVPVVRGIDDRIRAMAKGPQNDGVGTGGMVSKLQAAEIAERAGIALAIVNGTRAHPLSRALAEGRGTLFVPTRRDAARKGWIGGRTASRGTLRVDAGCAAALRDGASLLAVGITECIGIFARGDLVAVIASDGTFIAQGLIEYDADACRSLLGQPQSVQSAILGHAPRSAVIHRDQLVLL